MSVNRLSVLLLALCLAATAARAQPMAPLADPCGEGVRLFKAQDYAAAKPALKECLQRSGDSVDALLPLTVIAVSQDDNAAGVDYGEKAARLAPDNADAHYWYGRALLGTGKLDSAEAEWEKGLALDQRHAGILEGLARLAMNRGQDAKAYNLLNQLQIQGMDEPWLHRLLANLAKRKQLWGQAAEHLRDAMDVEGENAGDLVTLGELKIMAHQSRQAVGIFQRAVAMQPSGETYGGLGEAWFSANKPDSALAALRQAVKMAPEEPRHRFNLANVLEIQGHVDEAGEQFARYVTLAPDDPIGHLNYGIHLEGVGELEQALSEVDRAVAQDSSQLSGLVVKGQILEKLGRYDDALQVVGLLDRRDPSSQGELAQWRRELTTEGAQVASARETGKVHLMHIVTGDPRAADSLKVALARGDDFGSLAVRFSTGPTAAQGGDIGWVNPKDMVEPLRSTIAKLDIGATSPLVESKGLTHVFKRVR